MVREISNLMNHLLLVFARKHLLAKQLEILLISLKKETRFVDFNIRFNFHGTFHFLQYVYYLLTVQVASGATKFA